MNGERHLRASLGGASDIALLTAIFAIVVWFWTLSQRSAAPDLPTSCLATTDLPLTPAGGMVRMDGGRFKMGSDDVRAEEAPSRETKVEPFWIDRHDVTNAQFGRFVRETGYVTLAERHSGAQPPASLVFRTPTSVKNLSDLGQWWTMIHGADWRHPEGPGSSIAGRMHHPVVHVASADAASYATWAGRQLPTEAQWEFAARGGRDGDDFTWGNEPDNDAAPQANVWRGVFPVLNAGSNGFKGTSPVGCFPANGYGLYDMVGNVWQWTRDAWTPDHATAPASSTSRVIKGGSFLCATNFCLRYRPGARQPGDADTGASHIGFRTVLAVDGTKRN